MTPPSPIPLETAQRILDYDRAVFDRFVRKIRRLPKGAAFEDRGTGHGSFFGTLVHILNVREAWFQFIIADGGKDEETFFSRPGRKPEDWPGFHRYAATVWASHAAFRSGLTSAKLSAPAKAWWMPGRYSIGDVILQVSYEEAHHLGEIIGALWQKDIEPPAMTWIEVRRSLAVPRRPRAPRGRGR